MLNVVDPIIPILNSRKVQQGQQGLAMPIVDITLQYCVRILFIVTVIFSEHCHVRPW